VARIDRHSISASMQFEYQPLSATSPTAIENVNGPCAMRSPKRPFSAHIAFTCSG
jgi:hypothetical protein